MTSLHPPVLFALLAGLLVGPLTAQAGAAPATTLRASAAQPAAPSSQDGIAWFEGDVDAAFSQAKTQHKPLFLYWGADWCPPCNQVKATIFKRQDFIARSRFFIPVHIDGDSPGAQKLATRFKIRGYPTTILFSPDGNEITRLPGEVDSARYMKVLLLGMNAAHPVKQTLQAGLTGTPALSADEWRLLSFYSWDTDEQQLVAQSERATTLNRLAANAPAGEAALRLRLLALVALAADAPGQAPGRDNPLAAATLETVFGDTAQAHQNADVLTNYTAKMIGFCSTPGGALRKRLQANGDRALARLAADKSLSTTDQLAARDAQIAVARLSAPDGPLSPALLTAAQAQVAAASQRTTDVFERQSVISAAGDVLTDAGLLDQSDRLLSAELKRSHSPYYFMLGLAANAKKRNDTPSALHWYQAAYADAKGPATRLQWGTTYLNNLLDLAPDDEPRIEQVASAVFGELAQTPDAFYERNRLRLEATAHKLAVWKGKRHETAFARVAAQLNGVCAKLPASDAQRPTCLALLTAA